MTQIEFDHLDIMTQDWVKEDYRCWVQNDGYEGSWEDYLRDKADEALDDSAPDVSWPRNNPNQ